MPDMNNDQNYLRGLVASLVEHMLNIPEGQTLVYARIEEVTGLDHKRNTTLMRKVARQLVHDHGIFVITMKGIGYRRVRSGEEIKVCTGRAERGLRATAGAVRDMNRIRLQNMTPTQIAEVSKTAQHYANILALNMQKALPEAEAAH